MEKDPTSCIFCEEPVLPGEESPTKVNGEHVHHECMARRVVGSVGHQMGMCSCFGGSYEDPPGMTPRRAAQMAMAYYWWNSNRN